MKKVFVLMVALFTAGSAYGAPTDKLEKRALQASDIIEKSVSVPDNSIPLSLFQQSTCIATFPHVIRAGLGFGGQIGKGLVSCRTDGGWTLPAFLQLAGGSWGLQIGADSTDLVLVFVNPDAIDKVMKAKLTLGVGASVAAGPLGRDLIAGTDFVLKSEIYAYSRSRGLYAGLTLNGTVIKVDKKANDQAYGPSASSAGTAKATAENTPNLVQSYVNALMTHAN